MLVERGQYVGPIDLGRPSARSLEPAGDRRPRGDPCRFGPEQLGNCHARFGSTSNQARVHVVVKISDLDRLGHGPILLCADT